MHGALRACAVFFFSLGGLGLLLLGALDSSFLFLPLGNDLLIITLAAAHRGRMLYYVAMATAGSVIGVAFTHWVASREGQREIEGRHKGRRAAYVESKIRKRGGAALAVAALMPPPFPFTVFIIVAAALQYPLRKMLAIVAASRALRFAIDGALAVIFGRRILRMAQERWVESFVFALVAISIAGSAWSVFTWIRKSRLAR